MTKAKSAPIVEELTSLPEKWEWVQMIDIAAPEKNAIVDGPFGSNLKVSDYVEEGPVRVLTTKNLYGDYENVRWITWDKFEELKRSEVKPNDILMAKIGSCGKTGIYPANMPPAIIPANLMKITVSSELNQKYVYYYFDSIEFKKHLALITKATAQPAFGVTNFKKLPFPLAPIEQQKRIVAKIEELFSHIDAGIAALNKSKQLLKQYRQSVLKAAVTGELTKQWREENKDKLEPASEMLERILKERREKWEAQQLAQFEVKGKMPKSDKWKDKYKEPFVASNEEGGGLADLWEIVTLDQVSDLISGQHINSADYTDVEGEAGYAYLTGPSDFGVLYPTISKWTNTLKSVAHKGDVLITVKGSGVGKVNLLDKDDVVISRQLMALRPFIDEWYVYIFLLSKFDQLQSASTGTAIPGIDRDSILSMEIALPCLEEQNQIKLEFERLQSIIEKTEKSIFYQEQKALAEKQSILASAFSGKLVGSLESDGSAMELLEQIKQQQALEQAKEKLTKKRKPGKKKAKPMSKRKIIEVLKESKDFMTVEKIFESCGYGEDPDDIEDFYLDLKKTVEEEPVSVSTKTEGSKKTENLFRYVVDS